MQGETGSGKSTQVPHFILDALLRNATDLIPLVLCAQPRRVSALGLATRVSAEMGSALGNADCFVGYTVRGDSRLGPCSLLQYMTGGVLLRRMQSDPSLLDVSAVVIDEVHERDATTDILLSKLRALLSVNANIRIILMSATADAELFRSYFGNTVSVAIEGRTFPVRSFFLEDVLSLTQHRIDAEHPCAHRRNHSSMQRLALNITGKGGNVSRTMVAWDHPTAKEPLNPYFDLEAFAHISDSAVLQSLALVDETQVNINLIEDLLQVLCKPPIMCNHHHSSTGYMWSASVNSLAGGPQSGRTCFADDLQSKFETKHRFSKMELFLFFYPGYGRSENCR
jgi:ATP-dependent RNA helicase DHX29